MGSKETKTGSKLDLLNQLTRVEQERDELLQAVAILVFREAGGEAHLHPIDLARMWTIEVTPSGGGGLHLNSKLTPLAEPS